MSVLLSLLPVWEVLIFNIATANRCCHRKYSVRFTALVLLLFSLVFIGVTAFFYNTPFQGNGRLSLLGFVYLLPMVFLYRERIPLLLVIMCTCWVYTMGVFTLALQSARLLFPGAIWATLVIENLLFLATALPFYRWVVPQYTFVLEHLKFFDKGWYKYLALNSCLNFLALLFLNSLFLAEQASWARICVLLLILFSTYVSHFVLYKVVQDSLKIRRLERATLHDPLTGLGNRTQLGKQLQKLTETTTTFSILFMDLDRFKQINDRFGHLTGDAYLQHFSLLATEILQDFGQVFRFGGDEFVALCQGTLPSSTLQELEECPGWSKGAPCPFNGVSAGVLLCRPPHPPMEQILKQVDRLMYQKKAGGAAQPEE